MRGEKTGTLAGSRKVLRTAAGELLDLLFPPSLYCICCGNLIDRTRTYGLCDHCMDHIQWNVEPPQMRRGVPTIKCMEYGIYSRSIIFALKYNQRRHVARRCGEMMADRLAFSAIHADYLIPVPLHRDKLRQRGFNQAERMGHYLSRQTGTPLLSHGLLRVRRTQPMRGLSPEERLDNMVGAFALEETCREQIRGKDLLLLDDFCTTGSTAAACQQVLFAGGARSVTLLAFAGR